MERKWKVAVRVVLFTVVLAVGVPLFAAQDYPSKPINLYVGFPPGGVAGNTANAVAPGAQTSLKQPVVVQYKPGAGGTVAADFVVHSEPDGYTLINAGTSTLAYSMFTEGLKWGPKDFTVILGYTAFNYALVVPTDAPWKTFDDWVKYVKAHPGFKYGTYGPLSTMHVLMEWLSKELDLKLIPVHFKGDAPGMAAILGGHIQMYVAAGTHCAQVKAGKLRTLLQVSGEPKDANPQTVTRFKERFPKAPIEVFNLPIGIFGPKGIPASIRAQLTEAFRKSAKSESCARALSQMNMNVEIVEPEQLERDLVSATEKLGKLVRELNLKR
ncbi:MAG: tripartite tricarboxylate transporter substrate binding protein [Deltaproteobacteria bacterium]|nr:tripartite tricarboxylate transporter substrate binding protein [Deltaproteobacteria bacterium]